MQRVIENLYTTFAVYPCRPVIEGCPCCVSDSDKEHLHTKELRELGVDDLSRYAFKAMTTWGDQADFKHFLPRIFELLTTDEWLVDTFIVLGKLEYAHWENWPDTEKTAITEFLICWWTSIINHQTSFDKETFIAIGRLITDTRALLNNWNVTPPNQGFSSYVDLMYHYYSDLADEQKEFKELKQVAIEALQHWIEDHAGILEEGFFYYADQDPEFTEKISIAQYLYELGNRQIASHKQS